MLKKILIMIVLVVLPVHIFAATNTAEIAMDAKSGRIIYQDNIDTPLLVASTAKIMTAVIVVESGNLDKKVVITNKNLNSFGAGINLVIGEEISRRNLLYGLLLRSGNDAAYALAVDHAGSESNFATVMNQKAKAIGLKNSIFRNPSGLDDFTRNYMTARDLATLYRFAIKKPIIREIMTTKNYRITTNKNNYNWENGNTLLYKYSKITGGKNGYTSSSGRTLVTSAKRGQTELIVATINISNHYALHLRRYQEYFKKYYTVRLINHLKYHVPKTKYYKNLYLKDDITYLVTLDEIKTVKRKLTILKKKAKKGKVGYMSVYINNKLVGKTGVYCKGGK